LVHKKTSWYSFITPMRVAAVIARTEPAILRSLFRLGTLLGAAFQLRDDALSLASGTEESGKDALGDLWEGKHTLILAHALRTAPAAAQARALEILTRRRATPFERCIDELVHDSELSPAGARRLLWLQTSMPARARGHDEVDELKALVARQGSVNYVQSVAARHADAAARALRDFAAHARSGPDLEFLFELVNFVQERRT
jgi:geranylgeranyl diphosphate synthase type II